tara:strand:+ start:532 stop:1017 length:486 start_codon:yes stop_codon:yes gene_type:complete
MVAYSHIAPIPDAPEEQTLMGLAYDIRQSLKDSEYKELVELIMQKEETKKKFVKVSFRKVFMNWDDRECECECGGDCQPTLEHTNNAVDAIFEIVPNFGGAPLPSTNPPTAEWDATKITQKMLDDWKRTHIITPYEPCGYTGRGARLSSTTKWILKTCEEL